MSDESKYVITKEERRQFYVLMRQAKALSVGMEKWMQDHLDSAFEREEDDATPSANASDGKLVIQWAAIATSRFHAISGVFHADVRRESVKPKQRGAMFHAVCGRGGIVEFDDSIVIKPEKYCRKCAEILRSRGFKIPRGQNPRA